MCPFDDQVKKAPEYLQLELIDFQSSTELKHLFQRSEKLKFYNEYIHEDKFPNLGLGSKVLAKKHIIQHYYQKFDIIEKKLALFINTELNK